MSRGSLVGLAQPFVDPAAMAALSVKTSVPYSFEVNVGGYTVSSSLFVEVCS